MKDEALHQLIECARLLGQTQAKKGFGIYTQQDSRFEVAMYKSINEHEAKIKEALAQPEQEPVRVPWSQALESVWAEQEQALCDLAEDGVCETLDCPNHPIEQEPVATVTSETGADITMSWWHEPALPIGTKLYTAPPQRTWVGLMRGVRVEGDTVVISVKGGNDAARELCGALIEEKNT